MVRHPTVIRVTGKPAASLLQFLASWVLLALQSVEHDGCAIFAAENVLLDARKGYTEIVEQVAGIWIQSHAEVPSMFEPCLDTRTLVLGLNSAETIWSRIIT